MSTENEGPAAATPAAGSSPTQDAATSGSQAGGPPPEPAAAPDLPAASQDAVASDAQPAVPDRDPLDASAASPAPARTPAASAPADDQDFPLAEPQSQPGPAPATGTRTDEGTTRLARVDTTKPPPQPSAEAAGPAGGRPDTATTQLPPVAPPAPPAETPQAHVPPPARTPPPPTAHASAGGPGTSGPGHTPPPPPPGGYGGAPNNPSSPSGPGGPEGPWGAPPVTPPPGAPKRRGPGMLLAALLAVALIAGGVGGGIGFWAADRADGQSSTTVSAEGGDISRDPDSVAGIAQNALPSVVTIESGGGGGDSGTGTGFVFDQEGHILTNNHVVASAADGGRLTATFSDGKQYDAAIVGRAQGYDIAVLKLKGADDRELKPLPLGNSEKVSVGDTTIAIGAPYGLSGTVTTGIVSAKNRPVASSDGQGSEASYMSALQTDASINPGNSGGPLLNGKGAVIGVNSAIQSGGGGLGGGSTGSIGLGFAIPVNQAKRVAGQLIETGVPIYPQIGVRVATGQQGNGAVIAERVSDGEPVTPDGPADKAGLEPGDRITEFDGAKIDSSPTLIATIWAHEPGDTVELTYVRDGEQQTTEITLGSRKGDG